MTASIDIRGIAVKLLKSHHLRYIDMRTVPDPVTRTPVTVLKFRRDEKHSPKAFFDDLNENGIQYKKLVKDPEAVVIICELWPKGMKRRVSELREKKRSEQRAKENGGVSGPSNGNMPYVGVPSGRAQSVTIQSSKQTKTAGEQDWEEFHRKVNKVLKRMRLYERPEIRQLREAISTEIIKELGPDAELIQGARGSDLEKEINSCIQENIDLVLDTRGLADSVLRRTASSQSIPQRVAQLTSIRRGLARLATMAETNSETLMAKQAATFTKSVEADIQSLLEGKEANNADLSHPVVALVSSRKIESAYLLLMDSVYNRPNAR